MAEGQGATQMVRVVIPDIKAQVRNVNGVAAVVVCMYVGYYNYVWIGELLRAQQGQCYSYSNLI